jgi:hypothetical protein
LSQFAPILSDMPPDTISWSYIKLRGLSASLQPTYKYIFPDISPHDINMYIYILNWGDF